MDPGLDFTVFDISMPISEKMPVYKNRLEQRPRVAVRQSGEITESCWSIHAHTGTHLDAPRHVFPAGAGVEDYSLKTLISPCLVVDLVHLEEKITVQDLRQITLSADLFVLFKTKNSFAPDRVQDFVYLEAAAAELLAAVPVKGVGIDALGIERNQHEHPSHKRLLEKGIPILEGLVLKTIPAGSYWLIAAPLKLLGAEAAPCRAMLLKPLLP